MRLIVGLGNPGNQYADTRHNIGFMVIDALAEAFPVSPPFSNTWSQLRRATIRGQHVLLIQPQTYMNRSGRAVKEVVAHYGEAPEQLLVIHDDLDLDLGRLRIRRQGGAGGHKGVQSIIDHVGTNAFIRLRLGIGRPSAEQPPHQVHRDVVDYVL
ncbi:aminoacyl-tRNA hydrolase, partial [candidate division KSB3 bacterium]|nr:aminoacyl-tRNA hydrolase [candidate division KSB3 bacterium]MBD3327465.1 aminoacyl-tRNA hydrolase [candidate division KSB3 bacterium]